MKRFVKLISVLVVMSMFMCTFSGIALESDGRRANVDLSENLVLPDIVSYDEAHKNNDSSHDPSETPCVMNQSGNSDLYFYDGVIGDEFYGFCFSCISKMNNIDVSNVVLEGNI